MGYWGGGSRLIGGFDELDLWWREKVQASQADQLGDCYNHILHSRFRRILDDRKRSIRRGQWSFPFDE